MVTRHEPADTLDDFAELLTTGHSADRPPVDPSIRRRRRVRGLVIAAVVVALVVGVPGGYAAWALNAPVPAADAQLSDPGTRAEGAVVLPLPTEGATAISVAGADEFLGGTASGVWATGGSTDPLPIASITKLITAMVVLDRYPLASVSDPGPTLTFDEADGKLYDKYYVLDATIARMPAGSSMSLRDALATMLIPSASNYAEAIAGWAFGSQGAFVDAAERWLEAHGMTQTRIVEPTGIDPRNTATATDLITLGRLASANPTIASIAATRSRTIPGPGELVNTNLLLGDMGVTGLKTGRLEESGANLLYTSTLDVGLDAPLQIIGVVLGGFSHSTVNNGVRDVLATLQSGFREVTVAQAGQVMGTYSTAWGSTAELVVAKDAVIRVWSDTPITAEMTTRTPTTWSDGEDVGEITWTAGPRTTTVPVRIAGTIEPPSEWWRLTHPGSLG